jgi:hypothetical protein
MSEFAVSLHFRKQSLTEAVHARKPLAVVRADEVALKRMEDYRLGRIILWRDLDRAVRTPDHREAKSVIEELGRRHLCAADPTSLCSTQQRVRSAVCEFSHNGPQASASAPAFFQCQVSATSISINPESNRRSGVSL